MARNIIFIKIPHHFDIGKYRQVDIVSAYKCFPALKNESLYFSLFLRWIDVVFQHQQLAQDLEPSSKFFQYTELFGITT